MYYGNNYRRGDAPLSGGASLAGALANVWGRGLGERRRKEEEERQDERKLEMLEKTGNLQNALNAAGYGEMTPQVLDRQGKVNKQALDFYPQKSAVETDVKINNTRKFQKALQGDIDAGLYPDVTMAREKGNLDIATARENLETLKANNDPNSWQNKAKQTSLLLQQQRLEQQLDTAKIQHEKVKKAIASGDDQQIAKSAQSYVNSLQKMVDLYDGQLDLDRKTLESMYGKGTTHKTVQDKIDRLLQRIDSIQTQMIGIDSMFEPYEQQNIENQTPDTMDDGQLFDLFLQDKYEGKPDSSIGVKPRTSLSDTIRAADLFKPYDYSGPSLNFNLQNNVKGITGRKNYGGSY